jgi:TRAP-type C4-dicarboxylate transport system substrate-binding protein
MLVLSWLSCATTKAGDPLVLRIVGGLPGVTQYTQLEKPFWSAEIERISGGRMAATIQPSDVGIARSADMLKLMRLGTVPFGTALLAVAAGEEPDLNILDLPGLQADAASLRTFASSNRQAIAEVLRDRYRTKLLALYVYPAQVVFCARVFRGLADLAGRRVRTSSVGQSEFVAALGGVPIKLAFAEIVPSIRAGTLDCAITGTLSGNEIGLADVATHVHDMPINWGVSLFGANLDAWDALPSDARATIKGAVATLEGRIWDRAAADTALGLACNTGATACPTEQRKRMELVHMSVEDDALRRRIVTQVILPRWLARCGTACSPHSRDLAGRMVREE